MRCAPGSTAAVFLLPPVLLPLRKLAEIFIYFYFAKAGMFVFGRRLAVVPFL